MSNVMRRAAIGAAVMLALAAAPAQAADDSDAPADAECRKAEINPVTGHVFCIDPRGAPVEKPPADLMPPCKAEESRGQWTWAPNCAPEPEGR